jgi:PhoD-like phosphatase
VSARLVLGPLLRHVGQDDATVWVKTDRSCTVEVRAAEPVPGCTCEAQRTFELEGHHFALVHITGLPAGRDTPYEVVLDGERAWPPPAGDWDWPASCIRPLTGSGRLRVCFGSCRVAYPQDPPWTLRKDQDPRGREHDALSALAHEMRSTGGEQWPQLLLLLGDQVYADEVPPATAEWIAARRDTSVPPGEEVADFQEYCRLYEDSWSEPSVRWLLSTVPTAMIFDDHDIHDDWNTSDVWVREMRGRGWWDARIVGGFMSYWVFQHLGNLPRPVRDEDPTYRAVLAAQGDAGPIVRDFAFRADREIAGARWSYWRQVGGTRLVMMDSRAGRVLRPGGRQMVDDEEWADIEAWSEGEFDHLLLGTSLPAALFPGLQRLEEASEAICDGSRGRLLARAGEHVRQALDLEHWAAFGASRDALEGLLERVSSGRHGGRPGSVVLLSGDVHHAYLLRARFGDHDGEGRADGRAPVYQAVCSPFRNALDGRERRAVRMAVSPAGSAAGAALARLAGAPAERVRWERVGEGPWFDNQVATLVLDGRHAVMALDRAVGPPEGPPRLERIAELGLT